MRSTGPGNGMIDHCLAEFRRRPPEDGSGRTALRARGQVTRRCSPADAILISTADAKSTGARIRPALLDRIVADARHMKIVDYDLVATVTLFTARSIADECRQFIFPRGRVDQL